MDRHISPSILAADFENLGKEIALINSSKASWLHCDIMDGVFVPNISFGFPVVELASRVSTKPLDVHLMIVEPEKYIDRFCALKIDILTFHLEASRHIHRAVQQIRKNNVKAGVSLNPHTPVDSLSDIISDLDLVLIMSVNPGFGGQSFIENTYNKIEKLSELIKKSNSKTLIQVDGGINTGNARKLYACGADILVAGTSVFHSVDPVRAIADLLIS
jgi:ribulose-phosphate 3-epimerase